MASESPPAAQSPKAKGDAEVLSQRTFPGQGEGQEAPEGETSVTGHMGEQTPMATGDGGLCLVRPPTGYKSECLYGSGIWRATSF